MSVLGIKEALANYTNDKKVFIIWCDLILSNTFEIPRLSS